MAEGESKRNVIEMPIWFILFLVVVIFFAAYVVTNNKSVENLNASIAEQKTYIAKLETSAATFENSAKELQRRVIDGDITTKELANELGDLSGAPETEEVDGETAEQTVESGEQTSADTDVETTDAE